MAFCWWPNTLTTLWPVNISSTCPLRSPVCSHCAANCFCERLAMRIVTTTEMGTTSTEMRASSQLMENIMTSTPMMVSTAVMSCVRLCCSDCAMLSMSLVMRLRMSPRGWSSKYLSGRRASFSSTSRRRRYMVRCATPAMM